MMISDTYGVALLSGAMAIIGAVILRVAHLLGNHNDRLVKLESAANGLGKALDRDRDAVKEMRAALEADNERIENKIDTLMTSLLKRDS